MSSDYSFAQKIISTVSNITSSKNVGSSQTNAANSGAGAYESAIIKFADTLSADTVEFGTQGSLTEMDVATKRDNFIQRILSDNAVRQNAENEQAAKDMAAIIGNIVDTATNKAEEAAEIKRQNAAQQKADKEAAAKYEAENAKAMAEEAAEIEKQKAAAKNATKLSKGILAGVSQALQGAFASSKR